MQGGVRILGWLGGGGAAAIDARVTVLEQNVCKVAYFQSVGTSSGAVTKPTGSTILLGQFESGVDALVSTIVNGQPTGTPPETADGVVVTVSSFDTAGNYTLSGTPSAYPVALIYIFSIPAVSWANVTTANILEYQDANPSAPDTQVVYGTGQGITSSANMAYSGTRLSPNYITLAAGTTAAGTAPLVFTSGSLLTSPIAGAQEFLTDKAYLTITTGAARKEIALWDNTPLTAGNIAYTTTNGRMTTNGSFVWNVSRMEIGGNGVYASDFTQVTASGGGSIQITAFNGAGNFGNAFGNNPVEIRKTNTGSGIIIGSNQNVPLGFGTNDVLRAQFTAAGVFTLSDAVNMAVGTGTGTKIGTGTTQKIGFWNATPLAQQTTASAAATFTANTSGTLNDTATWDGYTIGQVVKILRNLGILA